MRIQIDSKEKIIKIDEIVNFGELVRQLEQLLPKGSKIGYWKDFKLETSTVINNWNNPFIINPSPYYPKLSTPWDIQWQQPTNICDVTVISDVECN